MPGGHHTREMGWTERFFDFATGPGADTIKGSVHAAYSKRDRADAPTYKDSPEKDRTNGSETKLLC